MGEMIILRDGVKRVEVGHGDVMRERERRGSLAPIAILAIGTSPGVTIAEG